MKINVKSRWIWVVGVKLWDGLDDEFQLFTSLTKFQKCLKYKILQEYEVEMVDVFLLLLILWF